MKQTAVEFLEMMYIKNSILSKNDFKIAKGLEKQQINSEQIAKEHFRKQRDEGILEQAKEMEKEQQGYSATNIMTTEQIIARTEVGTDGDNGLKNINKLLSEGWKIEGVNSLGNCLEYLLEREIIIRPFSIDISNGDDFLNNK